MVYLETHVDDGIGGGNSNFEKALEKLQKTLPFGSREHGRFKFTGLDIEQLPDHSIKVSQGRYVHKIPPIDIPKTRRLEPDSSITPQEMHQLRGLCGSLQYAAVHTRPDIATRVCIPPEKVFQKPQLKLYWKVTVLSKMHRRSVTRQLLSVPYLFLKSASQASEMPVLRRRDSCLPNKVFSSWHVLPG